MSKMIEYAKRLQKAKRIMFQSPEGVTDADLAAMLEVDRSTACRIRQAIKARSVTPGHYTCSPSEDDKAFAQAVEWQQNHHI